MDLVKCDFLHFCFLLLDHLSRSPAAAEDNSVSPETLKYAPRAWLSTLFLLVEAMMNVCDMGSHSGIVSHNDLTTHCDCQGPS